MQMTPPVMLFTAGFGTRMAPLTDHLPKPLIEVAGKPLVRHALDLVNAAGLSRIVANTHYRADQMQDYLATQGVTWLYEPEILETGGGLKNALPLLGTGPVLTLNSDAVWTGTDVVQRLLAAWRPDQMDALLLVVPRENAVGHTGAGDFAMTSDGRLARGLDLVYSGLQILKTDHLGAISKRRFSLNQVWNQMDQVARLYGLSHLGGWCDVGRPESIPQAEAMLKQRDV